MAVHSLVRPTVTILKINIGSNRDSRMGIARSTGGGNVRSFSQRLCLFSLLAIFLGCRHVPISDDDLVKSFLTNKGQFDILQSTYSAGQLACSSKSDPDICVVSETLPATRRLRDSAHVQSVYVKRSAGRDNGLWMPVETYGAMSTASSTRGYVYLNKSPDARVSDTLSIDQKGSHYKLLAGRWYLFTVN